MIPTLIEQYRRWFEYEKDSHRKVLASLESEREEKSGGKGSGTERWIGS